MQGPFDLAYAVLVSEYAALESGVGHCRSPSWIHGFEVSSAGRSSQSDGILTALAIASFWLQAPHWQVFGSGRRVLQERAFYCYPFFWIRATKPLCAG